METTNWINPSLVWFSIGFVLILMEFGLPSIVALFFGIGAWTVAILCLFFDLPLDIQFIVFITVSIITLIFLRKHFKKLYQGSMDKSKFGPDELEEFIGHKAQVVKEITPDLQGKVEFNGTQWKAESDEEIKVSAIVEIIEKNNLTLKVKSLKKEN